MDPLNPYPLIYCPRGVAKPVCCPHAAPMALLAGAGADVEAGGLGGGLCWGGAYRAGSWRRTDANWYVLLDGHQPQHLARMSTHPRIVRWQAVAGALPGQWWRVPVLLAPDDTGTYVSALDRVWREGAWSDPVDLEPLQRQLLAIANHVPLGEDTPARNRAVVTLAIDLLALGQWVDDALLSAAGWLSESLHERVIMAAFGIPMGANGLPQPEG